MHERSKVEMKKILLIGFICFVMLGIVVTPVSASTKIEITGTSDLVETLGLDDDWISGKIYHFRGLQEGYTCDFSDDRLDGYSIQSSNGNLFMVNEYFGYGPLWGTNYLENDGGSWTGSYTGKLTADGGNNFIEILHGHGGYEGYTAIIRTYRENYLDELTTEGVLIIP
jgi:hypothetical protein